jgi:hypothetical protein
LIINSSYCIPTMTSSLMQPNWFTLELNYYVRGFTNQIAFFFLIFLPSPSPEPDWSVRWRRRRIKRDRSSTSRRSYPYYCVQKCNPASSCARSLFWFSHLVKSPTLDPIGHIQLHASTGRASWYGESH